MEMWMWQSRDRYLLLHFRTMALRNQRKLRLREAGNLWKVPVLLNDKANT